MRERIWVAVAKLATLRSVQEFCLDEEDLGLHWAMCRSRPYWLSKAINIGNDKLTNWPQRHTVLMTLTQPGLFRKPCTQMAGIPLSAGVQLICPPLC